MVTIQIQIHMSFYEKADNEKINDLLENYKDLLLEHNERTGSKIETEYELKLSKTQKDAFDKFKSGESLLILGSAGTGKSKLVNLI